MSDHREPAPIACGTNRLLRCPPSLRNLLEHAQDADAVAVGGVLRHVERNLDVGHGAKVVDLGGSDGGDDPNEVGGVTEVAVVKEQLDVGAVAVFV